MWIVSKRKRLKTSLAPRLGGGGDSVNKLRRSVSPAPSKLSCAKKGTLFGAMSASFKVNKTWPILTRLAQCRTAKSVDGQRLDWRKMFH